ncbi:MAG: CoA-binding protein, partial [Armatimonadetes bacterium]|nr:CoA-binding protein [Armatimonadota bacterium]
VGVHSPDRTLIPEFVKALEIAGKAVWLVDANASPLDGRPVHPSLEGAPALDGALIVTSPKHALAAVEACLQAKLPKLWLDTRGDSREAADLAREAGIPCVVEACPLTTMPGVSWFHHLHGRIARWMGRVREV